MSEGVRELAGWGHAPVVRGRERVSEDLEASTRGAALARGLGRSYGDASLPPDAAVPVAGTRRADRLLAFDPARGLLRAEAGLSLAEMNRLLLPRGWFTPVSPGTQYVTLGGMVAADVHGKNHHRAGCLGEHVRSLRMRVADGRVLEVSEESEPELFRATLGGMGLTGHVLEVELALERVASPWIRSQSERTRDLETSAARLREASRAWPFSMAWLDSTARGGALGRGVVIAGRFAEPGEAPPQPPRPRPRVPVPFRLPSGVVAPWSIRPFNALYYRLQRGTARPALVSPEPFFYPLDALLDWNRLYGPRGFTQYQCVLPEGAAAGTLAKLLEIVQREGSASPVTVLKDCGDEGRGTISFPKRGVSLALDLPVQPGRTQRLVDRLNERVAAEGGRIYLAKDAFTRREHYRAMEPRLPAWNALRRKWDPEGRLRSALSARLLDEPA